MSKDIYEQALCDLQQLKQVAEDTAKKQIIESVTPRIKKLINEQLFNESEYEAEFDECGCDDSEDDDLLHDQSVPEADDLSSMSLPDEDGKVTLNLDDLGLPSGDDVDVDGDEYELSQDSLSNLLPINGAKELSRDQSGYLVDAEAENYKDLDNKFKMFNNEVKNVVNSSKNESFTKTSLFKSKVLALLENVEDMYEYVQERITNSQKKSTYENLLETQYKTLNKLQETNMRRKTNENVSFKINVPDEAFENDESKKKFSQSLDKIEVEIEDDEFADDEDGDMDMDDMSSDDGGDSDDEDMDMDSLDSDDDSEGDSDDSGDEDMLSGLDGEDESEEEPKMESRNRGKRDVVYEIDESVLRRELGKLRAKRMLREELEEEDEDMPSDEEDEETLEDGEMYEDDMAMEETQSSSSSHRVEEHRSRTPQRGAARRTNENSNNSRNRTSKQSDESKLRKQLEEANLFNAKLVYQNKLLHNESLTKKQLGSINEKINSASTFSEVKRVYDRAIKLTESAKSERSNLSESRVRGSSSRATGKTLTENTEEKPETLNEGFESARWARLAGIIK